jgi:hypothetical protein
MENIIKNHHYHRHLLHSMIAIIVAISFVLNIFDISIFEKSFNISLKSSNNVVLNLGGGLLKVYKSINIPIIKITNSIFGLSVYKDILLDNKLVKSCCYFYFKNDSQKKSCPLVSLAGIILSLNNLFKISSTAKKFYSNIRDDLNFCFLKNKEFVRFILLFMILMLVLPRGIPLGKISKKVNKMCF